MLLHTMFHWPEVVMTELWPFALKLTTNISNATPNKSGLSPTENFTRRQSKNRFKDFHTFRCLVLVVEAALQQGNKIL